MKEFPIEVLRNNMLKYVQTYLISLNEQLNENIKYHGLDSKIAYRHTNSAIDDIADIRIVDGKSRITFYDNFLQFLWCLSYSFLVFYDQNHQRKHKDMFNEDEFAKGLSVFEAGMSLLREHNIEQFYSLPNPTEIFTNDKFNYISKGTSIFLNAFSFILCHEFGHHYFGHVDINYNPDSIEQIKNDEFNADEFAFSILTDTTDFRANWNIRYGIITALSSLIFVDSTLKGGTTHPDPDDRLKSMLENMKLEETDTLWGWASLMFLFWSRYYLEPIVLNQKFPNDYVIFLHIYETCQKRKYK